MFWIFTLHEQVKFDSYSHLTRHENRWLEDVEQCYITPFAPVGRPKTNRFIELLTRLAGLFTPGRRSVETPASAEG